MWNKVGRGLQAMSVAARMVSCVLEARQMMAKMKSGRTVEQVVAERGICSLKAVCTIAPKSI